MKLWYVRSATGDNYIMVETADGILASNCAPDGRFAGISLYSYDERGENVPGASIAARIAWAIDPDLSEGDFAWMGEAGYESFEEWQSEQEMREPFNRDDAFPIHIKNTTENPHRITAYDYKELQDKALSPDATQEDINALGEWFERFSGGRYWNGEVYDIDGFHSLRPVQVYDEEHDCWDTTGYEIV